MVKKTSLYESLYLINKGADTVVQGLNGLQHSPSWLGIKYHQFVSDLQHQCTVLNLRFIKELQHREQDALQQLEIEMRQYQQAVPNHQEQPPTSAPTEVIAG